MEDQTINAADLERLRDDEAAARRAGFAVKPPLYALGTPVNLIGHENYRKSRASFEALPTAELALQGFIARIAKEARRDVVVRVSELTMLPDGSISRGSAVAFPQRETVRALLARTEFPEPAAAATYLAEIPPDRRANEVNALLRSWSGENKAQLRLRTDGTGNAVELYHVASEKYSGFDPNEGAAVALSKLRGGLFPGDCRAEVLYDGYRWSLGLQWHSDIAPERVCAGEIFKAAAGIEAACDGTASVTPWSGVTRNLCLNLIILDEARINGKRRVHRGEAIGSWLSEALREAVNRVRYFADAWDVAGNKPADALVTGWPETAGAASELGPKNVFRSLLLSPNGRARLELPGRREHALDALMRAWKKEPDPTVAGIVNAVTRAAHESSWGSPWAGQDIERQAGALLSKDLKPAPFRGADEF